MAQQQPVVRHYGGGLNLATLIGAGLAAYCSYSLGNPIGWIAVHALFNWFYLIYLCAGCGGGLPVEVF